MHAEKILISLYTHMKIKALRTYILIMYKKWIPDLGNVSCNDHKWPNLDNELQYNMSSKHIPLYMQPIHSCQVDVAQSMNVDA